MRILIVEDEPEVAAHIERIVNNAGYLGELAGDGEDAWFLGDTEDYAAVILDLGLPKIDGISVLKRWRENDRQMPVIVLTARGSWKERVEGINAGADDYLGKPFQPEELIARLRSVLRRSAGQNSPELTAGPLTMDTRTMQVSVEGVPVTLSPLEYRALNTLMHHKGEVVPSAELYEHVFGTGEPTSNKLEALMARLRKRLKVPVIETRRGIGYIIPGRSETGKSETGRGQ